MCITLLPLFGASTSPPPPIVLLFYLRLLCYLRSCWWSESVCIMVLIVSRKMASPPPVICVTASAGWFLMFLPPCHYVVSVNYLTPEQEAKGDVYFYPTDPKWKLRCVYFFATFEKLCAGMCSRQCGFEFPPNETERIILELGLMNVEPRLLLPKSPQTQEGAHVGGAGVWGRVGGNAMLKSRAVPSRLELLRPANM